MSKSRLRPGRLGLFVPGYRGWLLERGYAPGTVKHELGFLGALGRWMIDQGLEVEQLDGGVVDAYADVLRAGGWRSSIARRPRSLLIYLRELGVITPEREERVSALEEMIGSYREWLLVERGLAAITVVRYEALARRFLGERVGLAGELGVENLRGEHVTAFLLGECERLSVGSAQGKVGELRSLLRYLFLRGFTPLALAESVPPVAGWRDTGIPQLMPREDVERLIAGCDRSTLDGTRDVAMLLLLARLGLRSVEVSRLELADLDWRAGELVVRGKGGREDRLPLAKDVGAALAAYLTCRGRRDSRRVFLTLRAPTRPIRPDLVGDVVQRACERAGVAHVGAHRLRHALASEMLANGASLVDISQVLRHSDLATTAIYAKVDLRRLRQVAQPWPGAPR
ncbi:MAG: tyrosine-type recombinase/integrase [Solirubrobacteraceae bacterium]